MKRWFIWLILFFVFNNYLWAFKLDINSATVKDLEKLPGIGPVLAKRIIEYRKKHGLFKNLQELLNIKGIGIKKFNLLKNYLEISENQGKGNFSTQNNFPIYYYIDENGIYHFTHFPELVPEKYKKNLKHFK